MDTSAPQILQFGCTFANNCDYGFYAIGVNFSDGSFPLPVTSPIPKSHPAKVGDVITFYGVGFGQATTPLKTGAAVPSSPLPIVSPAYQFCFGSPGIGTCSPVSYSGASPGSAGLYQINVTIPVGAPTGDSVSFYITNGTATSDVTYMAIE
jgi:uncharacterized protein (TIGR03437 family)